MCCSQFLSYSRRPALLTGEPTETIHVDSDLVDLKGSLVRVSAENAASALQQKDFLVFEDGKPQQIVFFPAKMDPSTSFCCWICQGQVQTG
ncbi:hypothetical protein BH20ACI3_BH20ACI3_07410 [soil metagenome]